MKLKVTPKTLKAKSLKRKAQAVKAITFKTKAVGKVTYKNASASKKLRKFKVAAKTGNITVPEGTKRGVYKVRVLVRAAGDAAHEAASKTVTCTVKVK